jgi:hypothetical protein
MNWLRHELRLTAHFLGGNSNHGAKREITTRKRQFMQSKIANH